MYFGDNSIIIIQEKKYRHFSILKKTILPGMDFDHHGYIVIEMYPKAIQAGNKNGMTLNNRDCAFQGVYAPSYSIFST